MLVFLGPMGPSNDMLPRASLRLSLALIHPYMQLHKGALIASQRVVGGANNSMMSVIVYVLS